MTTSPTEHHVDRVSVAAVPSLDRACHTAMALIQEGVDGNHVAIQVEGLRVVEPTSDHREPAALAGLALRTAAAGALVGAVVAIVGDTPLVTWVVAGALAAVAIAVIVGAVSYLVRGRRAQRQVPRLGARQFVVQCHPASADVARRIVA